MIMSEWMNEHWILTFILALAIINGVFDLATAIIDRGKR
jgi:hypothetical protein